jgi:hypothetical protein
MLFLLALPIERTQPYFDCAGGVLLLSKAIVEFSVFSDEIDDVTSAIVYRLGVGDEAREDLTLVYYFVDSTLPH